jgi:branched-chain amino acid transport system ATP-binding protein
VCFETGQLIASGTAEEVTRNPIVQRVYFGEQAHR